MGLLKALAGSDLRLGVNWYLNGDEETNSDGKFVRYYRLRFMDPQLFDSLVAVGSSESRGVAKLERSNLVPRGSIFYSRPLPRRELGFAQRGAARRQWFANGFEALQTANIVFCDPDNGIASSRISESSTQASKYALASEIDTHLDAGQSVIVYQHQTRRKGGVEAEIQHWAARFVPRCPSAFAVVFRPYSVRIYFVLPSECHRHLLRERTTSMIAGGWSPAFEVTCSAVETMVS